MKIQDLTPAGQDSLQRAIAQEDEEWTRSRYWWDGLHPAYKDKSETVAAADMRRWNANWVAFKAALERGDDFEDVFVVWIKNHTPERADISSYWDACRDCNAPQSKFHEIYDWAKRQAEISAEEPT